jgi:hypothetical protein
MKRKQRRRMEKKKRGHIGETLDEEMAGNISGGSLVYLLCLLKWNR